MRRPVVKEIVGWLIFLGVVWVFVLGGPIPGWNTSAPASAPGPANIAITEPTASTAAVVIEPAASSPALVAEPATGMTSQIGRSVDGGASLTAAQPTASPPSPWESIPTIALLIILLAVTVFLIGVGVLAVFLWRHRRPRLVTPEGIEIEVEDRRAPATAQRPYEPRTAAPLVPRQTQPVLTALPAASPVIQHPWRFLTAPEALGALRALGHTPTNDQRIPDPEHRILELMARFRATQAAIAPDQSVVVFPNVMLPLEQIQRIASPQPAVLSGDGRQPLCIVGLWQPVETEITSTQTAAHDTAREASPSTTLTRVERTTQLIPLIPRQVPFPTVEQTVGLPHGTLPLLLAVQGTERTWITRSILRSGHWSIAGKSQRGKGNFIRYVLFNLLLLPPEQVQAIIIDLKGGADYGFALKLAHAQLYTRLDPDTEQASTSPDEVRPDGDLAAGFTAALKEMYRRNRLFMQTGVSNVSQYNARFPTTALPFIVVVVDEAHNLAKDLMEKLHELVSQSLSAGIVVLISTQHPANVISTQIRGNYSTYVAFKVEQGRNYVEAALGLAQGGDSLYDPSAIPDSLPGTAVLRFDDQEYVGRAPEITDELQRSLTHQLVTRYPRIIPEPVPQNQQLQPAHPPLVPSVTSATPVGTTPPVDLTQMTAAELIQAIEDPSSAMGLAVHAWLRSIGAIPNIAPRATNEPEVDESLRPYDLVQQLSLEACAQDTRVKRAVLRAYNELKAQLGPKLSGRQITARVFERVPGSNDGNTAWRWKKVVLPILQEYKLELPTMDEDEPAGRDPVSETGAAGDRSSVQLAA